MGVAQAIAALEPSYPRTWPSEGRRHAKTMIVGDIPQAEARCASRDEPLRGVSWERHGVHPMERLRCKRDAYEKENPAQGQVFRLGEPGRRGQPITCHSPSPTWHALPRTRSFRPSTVTTLSYSRHLRPSWVKPLRGVTA
jgi:hypothetical protein